MMAAHPGSPAFSKTFHADAMTMRATSRPTSMKPIPNIAAKGLTPGTSDWSMSAGTLYIPSPPVPSGLVDGYSGLCLAWPQSGAAHDLLALAHVLRSACLVVATIITPIVSAADRILVVTATAGFRHDSIPQAEMVIAAIGEQTQWFTPEFVREEDDLPDALSP